MLADRGGNQSCPLTVQLAHNNVAHSVAIDLIQVRNGLVEEQKIYRLTQRPNQSHTLLLAERHLIGSHVEFVANAQLIEPLHNPLFRLVAGELILNLHILHSRKFAKEFEVLKKGTQRLPTQPAPLLHREPYNTLSIEEYLSLVVAALAIDVAT